MSVGKSAPGKSFRKGISLKAALQQFGDPIKAEAWFVARRWPDGIRCAHCGSDRISARKSNRQTPQYHCKACGKNFTVKTGTIMHDSKLSVSDWALAFYLYVTNLKGVASMKLHRDLEIRQPSAWHLAHRIREIWDAETEQMAGPVEVDETYIGGKAKNMHKAKRQAVIHGRGTTGKAAVVGIKDRKTNQVKAKVIDSTDGPTLQGFVHRNTEGGATVYTDEANAYNGLHRFHAAVRHSVGEYVRDMAHTNGIESHWASLKRGHDGVYHHFSPKHLGRYVNEFSGRHNVRPMDTAAQMALMVQKSVGKRLPYKALTGATTKQQPAML